MRNMTRRRMMIISSSQSPSRIPTEYQEVQWLRGTGVQYCDTGYYPISSASNFTSIKGDVTVLDLSVSKLAIAGNDISGGNYYESSGIKIGNSNFVFYAGVENDTYTIRTFALADYGTAPLNLHYENNDYNVVLNDTSSNRPQQQFGNIYNTILIGAYRNSSGNIVIHNENVNIKAFSIYNKDTLLTDVIPCYRKSDRKPGFYVTNPRNSGQYFITNLGNSSDWLIGNKV